MKASKVFVFMIGCLIGLYLIYFVGAAVFLNSGLFRKVAGMDNDEQTYIKIHGAVSPFPGYLYLDHTRIFISDQNVSIPIDVTHAWIKFSIFSILDKRMDIDLLKLEDAKIEIGFKTPAQSVEYQRKYVDPDDLDLKKRAKKVEEATKSHITLLFRNIHMDQISEIKSSLGDFKGKIVLDGGFMIQPQVQVEVFPTTLQFLSGSIENEFSNVQGTVKAHIDRFRMIDAPGNAVFPYFNVELALKAGMTSLKSLNLTLRKLPGYGFDGATTELTLKTTIVKGVLQKGSEIFTAPSELTLRTPSLKASGYGHLKWQVDSKDTSKLEANVENIKLTESSGAAMVGKLKSIAVNLRLYGNELVDAFHGIGMTVGLNSLQWKIQSEGKNPNLTYDGVVTGGGELSGYSGELPHHEKGQGKTSDLKLAIEKLHVHTSFLSDLSGTGSIEVHSLPIDFTTNSILFPHVLTHLDFKVGKYGDVKTQADFTSLQHDLGSSGTWKGKVEWKMDHTDPFVDLLRDQDKMSAILGTAARVNNFDLKMECEVSDEHTWLRFNEITSSGIWKAYGTLVNERNQGMKGTFEAKVMNLPIGIRIQPEKTDVRFFPSAEWYDEPQPDLLPGVQ